MVDTQITPQQLQRRWQNAINRAIEVDGESAVNYLGDGRFLVISASDPARGVYDVRLAVIDGAPVATCTCKAAEHGFPCWHRATVLLMAGFVLADAEDAPADCPVTVDASKPVNPATPTFADVITGRYFETLKGAA